MAPANMIGCSPHVKDDQNCEPSLDGERCHRLEHDGQARHVAHEQIDHRPALEGERASKRREFTQKPASRRYDLGFIDLEQKTLQTLDNPFGPRLSPMS